MKRKATTHALLAAVAIAFAPSAAYAVNVSSSGGNGTQVVTVGYDNGFSASGQLRKASAGSPVYYSGLVVYNNSQDKSCGRYTTNTSSTTYVTKGGSCSVYNPLRDADGAKFRVCSDEYLWPDACGSWSPKDGF